MPEVWKLAQRACEIPAHCQFPDPTRTVNLLRSPYQISHPPLLSPPLRLVHSQRSCYHSSLGGNSVHHASLPPAHPPPGFGRRDFRRGFRQSTSTLEVVNVSSPEAPRPRRPSKLLVLVIVLWVEYMKEKYLPSWEEFLDFICRPILPKTVPNPCSPVLPHSNVVHNPTHQDTPIRQPILFRDELRVLVLEPGRGADEVRCRLVNVARSWRTRYDALSYAWGNETLRDMITVDGLRTSVTRNLHSALVHLRHPSRPRLLWVDALCIDQDNTEERDEQVAKMGSIYSSARRVIVWLGEETEEVEGAFSLLREAYRFWTRDDWKRDDILKNRDWSPVLNLLRRPWFQRTWIIQEAVLAREPLLACGSETLPFRALTSWFSSRLSRERLPEDPSVRTALDSMDMISHARREHHTKYADARKKKKYNPDYRLVSTLYETRGFQCKDKHDKVFGVLSLVLDVGPDDEVRKLGYGTSVEEVYEAVARWDISKNQSLEVLSYCSRKDPTPSDLPSWVPNFADLDDALPISIAQLIKHPKGSNRGFKGDNKPSFTKENGRTVLTLSGKIVDTISRVGRVTSHSKIVVYTHPWKGNNDSAAGSNDLARPDQSAVAKRREWFEECVRIAQASVPTTRPDCPKRAVNSFLESPTLGMSPLRFNQFWEAMGIEENTPSELRHGYANFLYKEIGVDPHWSEEWDNGDGKGYEWMDKRLREFSHRRRFCTTHGGRLGLVPRAAKEGDLVCLVSGAQVPIILRKVPGPEDVDRYVVVGDAHLGWKLYPRKKPIGCYEGGKRLAIV